MPETVEGVFMESIKPVLLFISNMLDYVFLAVCFFLYYLSVRKCFWKGRGDKVKLFLLALVTFPFTIYSVTTVTTSIIVYKILGIPQGTYDPSMGVSVSTLLSMIISTIIYVALILLLSEWFEKWLKTSNRKLVTFVSLMYSIIISGAVQGQLSEKGDNWAVGVSVNIPGKLILFIAVILLYRLVIRELSLLMDKERRINSRIFVIPPLFFTVMYNVISMVMISWLRNDNGVMFLMKFFSDIILFLFIWAFYVIIMNINATNEAIEAKDLAARMAAEEAKIEADLSIARSIQISALPCIFPPFPERKDFELFASMNAAKEVGGDFYDFYMIGEDTLGFLVADVSGKGVPAAMFMMTGKTIIKSLAESGNPPAEVFSVANEKLCEGNEAEMFITAWLGYLDLQTGLVRVANGGHNPPVLIRDGKAEYVILKPGLILAELDDIKYKEQEVQLQKGDILFLYTDGVTEAMDGDENLYGEKRLINLLSFGDNYPEASDENGIAGAVCELVKKDIDSFVQGADQSDDITMLCVRYMGVC